MTGASSKFWDSPFGNITGDEMSRRVSGAVDRFLDVRSLPDREVAQLSRDLEVDIAVDLKGFTQDCRTAIFANRAAPIQVSYLGYPGTMAGRLHRLPDCGPDADSRGQPAALSGEDCLPAGQLSGERYPASDLRQAVRAGG